MSKKFRPKKKAISAFRDAVCPGCVMGWGDCDLFRAVEGQRLGKTDLGTITAGRCPKRVNGTFGFSPAQGVETIDLSERAPSGAGPAMVEAITAHWAS